MIKNFPDYWNAPYKLLQIDGCCGLITAWGILRHFKKRVSSENLIKSCRYTKKYGTFTIALAVALREQGLSVKFFSELDPKPNAIEKRCYSVAQKIGVEINNVISLEFLLGQISTNQIGVVLYNTDNDYGHLTPLLGEKEDKIILPYSDDKLMPKQEFLRRWSEPEILKQCLVASV